MGRAEPRLGGVLVFPLEKLWQAHCYSTAAHGFWCCHFDILPIFQGEYAMKKCLFLAVLVIASAGCGEQSPERKAASDAAMKEIRMQRMAREFVSGVLKDPESAEFQNQSGFCGEVNSKNSYGGYGGYQRFIAGSSDLVVLERDSGISRAEFSKLWNKFCR